MADRLHLEIVTPRRRVVEVAVDEVRLPGALGEMGVLPGHTPLLTSLAAGPLTYFDGSTVVRYAVQGGFAEVLPDRVTILAQIGESAEEIDVVRAEAEKTRAQDALARARSEAELERARISMMKALVRLQVASRPRTRG